MKRKGDMGTNAKGLNHPGVTEETHRLVKAAEDMLRETLRAALEEPIPQDMGELESMLMDVRRAQEGMVKVVEHMRGVLEDKGTTTTVLEHAMDRLRDAVDVVDLVKRVAARLEPEVGKRREGKVTRGRARDEWVRLTIGIEVFERKLSNSLRAHAATRSDREVGVQREERHD